MRVQGYEVIYYGQGVVVQYPEGMDGTERKKPEGRSFHHGRFIQKLRGRAMQEPNITVIESTATEVIKNGWTGQVLGVQCKTGGEKDYVRLRYLARPCDWSCNAMEDFADSRVFPLTVLREPDHHLRWLCLNFPQAPFAPPTYAFLEIQILRPRTPRLPFTLSLPRPCRSW